MRNTVKIIAMAMIAVLLSGFLPQSTADARFGHCGKHFKKNGQCTGRSRG